MGAVRHIHNRRAFRRRWLASVLAAGLAPYSAWAQIGPCDPNEDGLVDIADVQLAVNRSVGAMACSANLVGAGIHNTVVVERVLDAALAQELGTDIVHSVTLTWQASPSTNVVGYNIYRGATSGGPFTLLNANPIDALTYVDTSIQVGQTYFYVVRAVGGDNTLSDASNEAMAAVSPARTLSRPLPRPLPWRRQRRIPRMVS